MSRRQQDFGLLTSTKIWLMTESDEFCSPEVASLLSLLSKNEDNLTRVLVVLVDIDADVAVAAVLVGRALLARARVLLLFLLDQRLHQARHLHQEKLVSDILSIHLN